MCADKRRVRFPRGGYARRRRAKWRPRARSRALELNHEGVSDADTTLRYLGGTPIQRVAEISWRTLRYLGVAETVVAGTVVVVGAVVAGTVGVVGAVVAGTVGVVVAERVVEPWS